ncbi:MAG: hypothetical protein KIT48_00010 [Pseudolabrys sp.]|nr:hypothetical protein [Pseudolabrys sp.]
MAFVAYLISLVAAFVGVLALYGTLLKPMTGKPLPAQTVAAEKAEPETTSSTRARPAPAPKHREAAEPRKREAIRHDEKRDEAHEARAQESAEEPAEVPADAASGAVARPDLVPPRNSRRSPVRSEPGEGLRLAPERCWVVTDSTRGFGYYGRCQ